MSVLNDKQITALDKDPFPMIEPFGLEQIRSVDGGKVISYGLSSYGYDARVADEFQSVDVFARGIIDPKDCVVFRVDLEREPDGGYLVPAHGFTLCRTVEYFRVPDDVMVICLGKSTYARCGLIVNVTPLEPGWEGHVTLELSNTTSLPIKVYPMEGICQFVFFRGERPAVTYADRGGKYQGQTGVTTAKV